MIDFGKIYNVHFIGVGGISMNTLALFCKSLGWRVSGSDICKNKYTEKCKKHGIKIFLGQKGSNIGSPDFIVASSAIKLDNEELMYAHSLGIKIYSRAEFLSFILKKFNNVIAIAGTHGKSTTCAMLYQILKNSGEKVSCHIGAEIDAEIDLNDDILVLEACEYNKNFLKFKVDTVALLNVEKDHLECYGSFYQLKNVFLSFLKHAKKRYVFSSESTEYIDLKGLIKIETPQIFDGYFTFEGRRYSLDFLCGDQYAFDACVAIKLSQDLGVSYKIIYDTLKDFRPLKRRQELIALNKNCEIYVDYAHHPTEIKYNLNAFKKYKTLCVFQPHTFSRTKFLKNEFVSVLSKCDCIIYKEYSAREKESEGMTAQELFLEVKGEKCKNLIAYANNESELKELIKKQDYEKIIFFGAGDINNVALNISKRLSWQLKE